MNNLAMPLAHSKGKIVSIDAVTLQTTGFTLLRNGSWRVVNVWSHPSPPPVSKRRCKTISGKLPAVNPRPASSDDDESVAVLDTSRIEPARDPPLPFKRR
jgi:hypothetical protein